MNDQDEVIDHYVDRTGVTSDTEFLSDQLTIVLDQLNALNKVKIKLNLDSSWQDVAITTDTARKATDNLTASVSTYNQAQKQVLQIQQDIKNGLTASTAGVEANARAISLLKLAVQDNLATQKQYKQQLDAGQISLDQYVASQGAAIVKQNELKASVAALNKELSASAKAAQTATAAPVVNINGNGLRAVPGNAPTIVPSGQSNAEDLANLEKTGTVVNQIEADEAAAAVAANEWAAGQREAVVATEELAEAQGQSLGPLGETASILAQQKLALSENVAAQKEYSAALEAGTITRQEYIDQTAAAILEQTELKASIASLNKELTTGAKLDLAIPGGQNAADAQNAALIAERRNIPLETTDPAEIARRQEINDLLDKNNALIDANSSKLEQQKINIGNYPSAFTNTFTTLETELTKVNTALSQEGLSGQSITDLTSKQMALKNATALIGQEFSTTTAQSNAFKESARQIGLVYGTNDAFFKQYNKDVAAGAAATEQVTVAVKNASGNSSIFSQQLEKVGTGLSNIGRNIGRLIGLGLIFAGVDLIVNWVKEVYQASLELKNLNDASATAAYQIRQMDGILDGTANSVEKVVQNVEDLKEHFKLAEDGVITKTAAVKLYNDTMGQSTGIVDTLDQAEQKLAAHAQAYINFTLLKAAANVALQKASEKAFQAAETAAKPIEDFSKITDVPESIGAGGVAGGGDPDIIQKEKARDAEILANRKERQQKEIDQANAEKAALLQIAGDFYHQAEAAAKANGLFFDAETIQQQVQAAQDAIQLQIDALTRYENKQNDVANNDKNTYYQRQQALINYNNTVKQIIALQTKKDLLPETGNQAQQNETLSKQQTELQKATIDGANRLKALNDSYNQRKIEAIKQTTEAELQEQVTADQAIYTDESNSLDKRLAAYTDYIAAEKQLADLEYVTKLKSAGFSDAEIAAIEAGEQVQINGKKITLEELEALQVAHNDKMKALASTAGKDVYDITASWAKRQEQLALQQDKGNNSSAAQAQYDQQLAALDSFLAKGLVSITTYNAKRAALDEQYAIAKQQAAVDDDNKSLANLQKNQQDLLEQEFYADNALQAAIANSDKDQIDANQKKLDALKNAEQKNADDIAAIQKKAADAQVSLEQDLAKSLIAAKTQEKTDEQKLEQAGIDIVKNALDSVYEAKIAEIQAEITAVESKAQTEIAAEQSTTDDAQTQADKIGNINARAAQQEQQLTDQQNAEKRKEAEVDRIAQIAKIAQEAITTEFSLAAKAASAQATGALLLADPATAAYAPIAFASAAAIGADEIIVAGLALAQAAAILATPLPAYKYGTQGKPHPGGPGRVGDGGRSEILELPSGLMYLTPPTDTVVNMPAGTNVYPDARKVMHEMRYSGFGPVGSIHSDSLTPLAMQRQLMHDNRRQTDRIIQTIKEKQELRIAPGFNGMMLIHKYGDRYAKWVGKALHHRY